MNTIEITKDYDRFKPEPKLGDLTHKQYAALEAVAKLSLGYLFEVVLYEEHEGHHGSGATHIKVWSETYNEDYVGLVGRDCMQHYDNSAETAQVVHRVSQCVYHN